MMQELGQQMDHQEVLALVAEVNTNNNGSIDFEEFLAIMVTQGKKQEEESKLVEAFMQFDLEGTGYITEQNLRHIMMSLGDQLTLEETNEMIKYADCDGDGYINYKGKESKTAEKIGTALELKSPVYWDG